MLLVIDRLLKVHIALIDIITDGHIVTQLLNEYTGLIGGLTDDDKITELMLCFSNDGFLCQQLARSACPTGKRRIVCCISNAKHRDKEVICINPAQLRLVFPYLKKMTIYKGDYPVIFSEPHSGYHSFSDYGFLEGDLPISITYVGNDGKCYTKLYQRIEKFSSLCNLDYNAVARPIMRAFSSGLFWTQLSLLESLFL